MAENPTHLETHTGLSKKVRVSATAPTDPTPENGDMYVDNTVGREALGIYSGAGWLYISLRT
jgi:hypothetical protein